MSKHIGLSDAQTLGKHVTLAHPYNPDKHNIDGWLASLKLDGLRSVYYNGVFASRNGNIFYAPEWFSADFPKDKPLDGELWMKVGAFRETVSIVKTKKQTKEQELRWQQLTFQVFDTVDDETLKYKDRYEWLKRNMTHSKYGRVVKQTKIKNSEHLYEMLEEAVEDGDEGIIARDPDAPYEHKRSNRLLKIKKFHDCEVLVMGSETGSGRNEHVMGKLICKLPSGAITKVGSGFNDEQRKTNPFKVGSVITIKYFELDQKSGRPRFPTFLRKCPEKWENIVKQYSIDHPKSIASHNHNDDVDDEHNEEEDDDEESEEDEKKQETTTRHKKGKLLFEDEVFCVSGTFSMTQDELCDLIEAHGGRIVSTPSKKCTYLVSNFMGSAKTIKAKSDGITIVTEKWVTSSIHSGKRSTNFTLFL